jgi:hypothetical protein
VAWSKVSGVSGIPPYALICSIMHGCKKIGAYEDNSRLEEQKKSTGETALIFQ